MLVFNVFFFNDPPTTEIYTLSLHDALPICRPKVAGEGCRSARDPGDGAVHACRSAGDATGTGHGRMSRGTQRSEEHTSELQSHSDLVCRLLLEKKKKKTHTDNISIHT